MSGNKTPIRIIELLSEAVAQKGQSAVARESGLTQPTIHRYLRGVGEPNLRTLKKLEKYFNVPIGELREEQGGVLSNGLELQDEDTKPKIKRVQTNVTSTPPMVTKLLKKAIETKSQNAISRETGIPLLSIQLYLKGIGEPTTKTLRKLAEYFGVSVTELRGEFKFRLDKKLIRDILARDPLDRYNNIPHFDNNEETKDYFAILSRVVKSNLESIKDTLEAINKEDLVNNREKTKERIDYATQRINSLYQVSKKFHDWLWSMYNHDDQ